MHFARYKISQEHIDLTFDEIKSDRMARLSGLMAHFCYWCVFGHMNTMPLDKYHMKQLFISISQCVSNLQQAFATKKQLFGTFVMPFIVLAVRVEMEIVFKMNYVKFMENPANEVKTMRFVNGVITEVLDPQVFFSRFSFLESGKEALDQKGRLKQSKSQSTGK